MSEEINKKKEFCRLLDDAIADEDKAPAMYEKIKEELRLEYLAITTESPDDRLDLSYVVVERIQKDEVNHKEQLEAIKHALCR